MCLEDRFLFVLYNQPGFVPLAVMSEAVSITENALLSIINRINNGFPDYILLQENPESGLHVSPNLNLQQGVRLFLADGGFSAINEQELRKYYTIEMAAYDKMQKIRNAVQEYDWIKWAGGTLLTIGASFGIFILIRSIKRQSSFSSNKL